MSIITRIGSIAALALLAAFFTTSTAWGVSEGTDERTWVIAQADPMVDGSVGVQHDGGEEGVDANLQFEFGGDEEGAQAPVAAGGDDGIPTIWLVAGIGVVVLVLLVALLSRSGGGTTVVRD